MAEENIKVPDDKKEWLAFWADCSAEDACPETDPCRMLQKHVNTLLNGKSNAKIYVPLCSKTIDIKWLADQEHTVVGLEVAESVVQGFFREQKVEFTTESAIDGKAKVYKSTDGKIKIYAADFFDFTKDVEGSFDAVWDRRAMISIEKGQYPRYVALIKSLLKPDGRCLFVNADFDRKKSPGPRLVTEEMLRELYKEYNVEYVDEMNTSEKDDPVWFTGYEWFKETMYLITKK